MSDKLFPEQLPDELAERTAALANWTIAVNDVVAKHGAGEIDDDELVARLEELGP